MVSMNYLPKGFRDYAYERADALHEASQRVAEVYARWGFRRFVPSLVEDAETFARGADTQLLRQSFRFADRSGEMLALRADMTLQAARVMAGELAAVPPPLRLFYVDRVLRNVEDGRGALREVWQAGAELAGAPGPEADAEIIAVTLEALSALGAADLQVDLGHAGFLKGILARWHLDESASRAVLNAFERKDVRLLDDLRQQGILDDRAHGEARVMAEAFGLESPDAVDALGVELDAKALRELRGIVQVLGEYGVRVRVTFDPGEVGGFAYYSGFFFHVYAPGLRQPLAAGGRYDGLLKDYGRDLPAVGCAIDLAAALPMVASVAPPRIHIVNLRGERGEALRIAQELRALGCAVSRDIVRRPWSESLEFARRTGIRIVLILEADGTMRALEPDGGAELPFAELRDLAGFR